MISFRYHIVSIVSVFLALAIGVALGGGPLKGEVDNTLVEQVQSDRQAKVAYEAEIASLRSSNKFTDTFAATVAPALIGNRLAGRSVAIVELPGADQSVVASLEDYIGRAGASVTGRLRVASGFVDPGNKQLVDALGRQQLDSTPDVKVPRDASGYERMGALLGRAIATKTDAGAPVDPEAASILSGLSTANLMSAEGDLTRRASLVLFVAGPGTGSQQQQQGTATIVTELAKAVDARSGGVVVAGPLVAARQGGLIAAVRADVVAARDVSTVDDLDRTAGQVVTVMALAEQAHGKAGQYGAVDAADGAMPGADAASE